MGRSKNELIIIIPAIQLPFTELLIDRHVLIA